MGIHKKDAPQVAGLVMEVPESLVKQDYLSQVVDGDIVGCVEKGISAESIQMGLDTPAKEADAISDKEEERFQSLAKENLGPAAHIVSGKRIALIKRLAEKYHESDPLVWELFVNGATCAGRPFFPENWDVKKGGRCRDDCWDGATLIIGTELIRGSIESYKDRGPPSFMSEADQKYCWDESSKEARDEVGLLEGPFTLVALEAKFAGAGVAMGPVAMRFVVHQSDKDRLVGDCRVLSSFSSWGRRIPLPTPTQALGAATTLYRCANNLSADGGFRICPKRRRLESSLELLDLKRAEGVCKLEEVECLGGDACLESGAVAGAKSAYKTTPIKYCQRQYNCIVVCCPEKSTWFGYIANSLVFGDTQSVSEYIRFAEFLRSLHMKLLELPALAHIDDHSIFAPRGLGLPATSAAGTLWDALGVDYKAHKLFSSEDEGRDDTLPLLGLEFDLRGRPLTRISDGRVAKIRAVIMDTLTKNRLSPGDGSKLLGELSHAFCSVADRRFNPILRPLVEFVFSKIATNNRVGLSKRLKSCFLVCRSAIQTLPYRSLDRPGVSYALLWRKGRGCVAGVLWNPSSKKFKGWYRLVNKDELYSPVVRSPINFLEGIAAVTNARFFSSEVGLSDCIFAIDNSAAEDLLLNMSSGKPHLAGLAYEFWSSVCGFQKTPWVTRVPTELNIADWLTHIDLRELVTKFFNFDGIVELRGGEVGVSSLLRASTDCFEAAGVV